MVRVSFRGLCTPVDWNTFGETERSRERNREREIERERDRVRMIE